MEKTVLLVDDHAMLREGLKSFLEQNSEWRVIGEAGSAKETWALFADQSFKPAAAIIDISLPDRDGIELVRSLLEQRGDLRCIMYSMHVTAEYIQTALQTGALAYVSKSSPSEEVLAALDAVFTGNPYLDGQALKIHLARYALTRKTFSFRNDQTDEQPYDQLTFQEGRVFSLASRNMTNAEIAETMGIKLKTVENYISIIYQKLGLKNRYELVVYAKNNGSRM